MVYTLQDKLLTAANNTPTIRMENITESSDVTEISQTFTLFVTFHGYQVTLGALLIAIVTAFMGVIIIILNSVLLHTLVKCRSRLDVTDRFIQSLAITDLVLGVLVLYNTFYNILNFQNRHECLFRVGIIHSMLINSTGHISLLTINRYIRVIKPLHYSHFFTKRRIVLSSAVVWVFSLTIGALPLAGWNKVYDPLASAEDQNIVCRYFGVMPSGYLVLNVCLFWIPVLLMTGMYSHICRITLHHQRQIRAQARTVQGSLARIHEGPSWRLTKTVLTVIGAYFFSWLPTGMIMINTCRNVIYVMLCEKAVVL